MKGMSVGGRLLHTIARLAIRLSTPVVARKIVFAAGSRFRKLSTIEATRLAHRLRRSGTCLTRALTIAALLPDAEVVVGRSASDDRAFAAHAWVEHDGFVIDGTGPAVQEIGRL